jgi:hypothetical protein
VCPSRHSQQRQRWRTGMRRVVRPEPAEGRCLGGGRLMAGAPAGMRAGGQEEALLPGRAGRSGHEPPAGAPVTTVEDVVDSVDM